MARRELVPDDGVALVAELDQRAGRTLVETSRGSIFTSLALAAELARRCTLGS